MAAPSAIDFLNAPDPAPNALEFLNAPDPKPDAVAFLNTPDAPANSNPPPAHATTFSPDGLKAMEDDQAKILQVPGTNPLASQITGPPAATPTPQATAPAPLRPINNIDDLIKAESDGAKEFANAPEMVSPGSLNFGAIPKHVLSKWVDTLNAATGSTEDANADPEIQKLRQEGDSGVVTLPKPLGDTAGAGIVRGLETTAEGMLSPENLTLFAALGGAPGAVQKVAAAGFAAMMAKGAHDKMAEAMDDDTPGGKAQKITEALAATALAILAAKHAGATPERIAAMREASDKAKALNEAGDPAGAAEVLKSAIPEPAETPYRDESNDPATLAAEGHAADALKQGLSNADGPAPATPATAEAAGPTATPEASKSPEAPAVAPLTESGPVAPVSLDDATKLTREAAGGEAAPKDAEAPESTTEKAVADDWTSATDEKLKPAPMLQKEFSEGGAAGGAGGSSRGLTAFADRKMSELDAATAERSGKLQRSTDDARRAQSEIDKAIPNEARQGGVSLWVEADGDAAKLAAWEAGAKGKEFKAAAKAAQSLSPKELAVAQKVKASFDALEKRGNKYDVLKSHRDNYVPHVWDVDKSKPALTGGGRLQQNFKFAKARTFETFADGDAAGFKPKTLAIGKILPAYLHEMNKVIADRQFVEDLSNAKAKDGRPLVVPRGRVSDIDTASGGKAYLANPRAMKGLKDSAGNDVDTSDYKTMENQPALHDWRWEGKDTEGNPIFMKDDLALHPEAAKRLNSMLGKSALREWYNEPGEGVSNIPKAIVRGLDTAQSVMKREMFSLLSPFHQVQEGWHAISHLVNPFFGLEKIDLRNADQLDATKHGLMLLPDKTSAQNYLEGVGGKGGFVSQVSRKLGGPAGKAIADVIDGYQDYLFHSYIPSLKYSAYKSMLERNSKRFAPELSTGKITTADVKLLSAEQSNAAFGHLNYALSDRNPTIQHFAQLTLLAPDFLEARGRFAYQAGKALLGDKGGREQLKAIATMALIQAGIAYATTKLGGEEWDPKHPFEAVHGGRRYTLRSVPEDIASAVTDPRQFIYGRVNPLTVKGGTQLMTGLNYRGEKTTALHTMEELLAQYIPITARSIPGVRSLTETSKQSPISPLEQLAGAMGLRISRKSPISDTYKLAGEWMEKKGVPKDSGSYPVSKFQQLRYALEDGDMSRAGEELDKLTKDSSRAKVLAGFKESVDHPFTKSITMDSEFRKSLDTKGAAVFDLAKQKRAQILLRVGSLR